MYLGMELGSTRIKAVGIDRQFQPHFSGDWAWQSKHENGYWTYDIEQVWEGLRAAIDGLNGEDVQAAGVSGMMHGYLAFDEEWRLLTPFRTWQNTTTEAAAKALSALFGVNIPQRWSIAHLYQAMLNGEAHLSKLAHVTTLAGYVHYRLTGENVLGIGEASGMFPVDGNDYDPCMLAQFDTLLAAHGVAKKSAELLPAVKKAGEEAGCLTAAGVALLGGKLSEGVPFVPPEGDGPTGMVATNAVAPRSGNVSAGTSVFAMMVMERPLTRAYEEIDVITTPTGAPVAMVHCINGTADSNRWVALLKETAALMGVSATDGEWFRTLYTHSLEGEPDCGGITVCNYTAGEHITGVAHGFPLVTREPNARFTAANFFRAVLYSALVTLKIGNGFLQKEGVACDVLYAHGGLFKTPLVGQRYLAAALDTTVVCMDSAGEGGPYGMALLAAYRAARAAGETLEAFLSRVFAAAPQTAYTPTAEETEGFERYTERFLRLLAAEKALQK